MAENVLDIMVALYAFKAQVTKVATFGLEKQTQKYRIIRGKVFASFEFKSFIEQK